MVETYFALSRNLKLTLKKPITLDALKVNNPFNLIT